MKRLLQVVSIASFRKTHTQKQDIHSLIGLNYIQMEHTEIITGQVGVEHGSMQTDNIQFQTTNSICMQSGHQTNTPSHSIQMVVQFLQQQQL